MQMIVLGMHRSGTSSVARLLNMMGAYFAAEGAAMLPTDANPKGYWERNDVVQLNEGILANLGATWDRISSLNLDKITDGLHKEFDKQARNIIFNLDSHRPWMIKDPRFCLLLPLWLNLMEVPLCIYVYRNPIQVAQSLYRRDRFSIHLGMALWEKYNLWALTHSSDIPRILVSYHDLMDKPIETVNLLYEDLQANHVQGLRLPNDKEILSFIELGLLHAKGEDNLQRQYSNHNQAKLFQSFENKTIFQLNPLPSLSEGSVEVLREYENHFFEKLESERKLQTNLQELKNQHVAHREEIDKITQQMKDVRQSLQQSLQQKIEESKQYQQALLATQAREEHLEQELSSHQSELERYFADVQSQDHIITEQRTLLADRLNENRFQFEEMQRLIHWLEVLNHDLNAVFSSQTWKMGDAVTNAVLKLTLRAPGQTARDHIQQVMQAFFQWRMDSLQEKRRYQAEEDELVVDTKKKVNIAALVALHNGEPSASASIRLILPFQHPTLAEKINFEIYTTYEYLFNVESDIIVVQRHMLPTQEAAQKLVDYCKKQGIKLIYEIDDDLYNIFKKRDIHGSYPKSLLAGVMVATECADLVITSSPFLQQQIQSMNPNVICIPNALDENLWLEPRDDNFIQPTPKQIEDKIRILYMGTKTHTDDLKIVQKAYQQLKNEYSDKVILEIVGGVPDGTKIFGDIVEVTSVGDFRDDSQDDYSRFVHWFRQTNHWQFGIIPLQVNEFNNKKTYIKFLDYTALGIPCICTDIAPYREVVRHEENGLLIANDTQSWYQAMKRLVDDIELRHQLAKQAFEDLTQGYILKYAAQQFYQAYTAILDKPVAKPSNLPGKYQRQRQDNYLHWLKKYDPLDRKTLYRMTAQIKQWTNPPLISVVMPVYNIEEKWLRAAIESVRRQIYPHWELCIADDASTHKHIRPILEEYAAKDKRIKVCFRDTNGHISAASNSALELVQSDYVALLDHDDKLTSHALYWVASEIIAHPDVELIYSDEDKINERDERFGAYFKCDWNPDLFLSHNLITHLAVYKTQTLRDIHGFRVGYEGAQDYDLALRVVERIKPQQIRHIPKILYHWRAIASSTSGDPNAKPYALNAAKKAIGEFLVRKSIKAHVAESSVMSGMLRVQYALPANPPLVSLIIPTRNQVKLLRLCVESILASTSYPNYEILIVDNNSDDPETLSYFKSLGEKARIIPYHKTFNYAAINNLAVQQAKGELVGLLNNDIEVISKDWLTEMVSHALRPDIGAVGARLWYPHDTLQHGGILLGVGGIAEHAHKNLQHGQEGYFGRAQVIQNFSAVTAACMVLKKSAFLEVGGLDEQHLTVAFNDIDLCLKLAEKGLRTLWTPYAELYHHESASRGYEDTPEKQARLAKEANYMQQRWKKWIQHDPAYSPNLNHKTGDFGLNWEK